MKQKKFTPIIKKHSILLQTSQQTSYTWLVPHIRSFDELIISWNANRPLIGHYVILSSVYIANQWSPWLLYAVWGAQYQFSFYDSTSKAPVHSFQDQIQLHEGKTAEGFRIRIEACGGANLEKFYTIYSCCSSILELRQIRESSDLQGSFHLPMQGLSQMCLNHPRSMSLCSPTSTTAAIHFVLNNQRLDPLEFAHRVYDAGFDIYGNWSFNVAQAFIELNSQWHCFCARVSGFQKILQYLKEELPIVVSIKGNLTGSFTSYPNGHLIVVRGYDSFSHRLLCMDPAFPSDNQTLRAYPWEEFMQAWEQRGYLAYFFLPIVDRRDSSGSKMKKREEGLIEQSLAQRRDKPLLHRNK